MEDTRKMVQGIIDKIAKQEAVVCKENSLGGGAIVVLLDLDRKKGIERKRALARTIVRGTTPQAYLVRFLDKALDHALSDDRRSARTEAGTFTVGVAGFPFWHKFYVATRVIRSLELGRVV